jgi:hypothetical protein
MRLSLLKAAYAVILSAARQEIRVRSGRDDKGEGKRVPGRCQNISMKGPRNCRSLGFPRFPVESCGFDQVHVVLFAENHIPGRGECGEAGNLGTLGMTNRRGWL